MVTYDPIPIFERCLRGQPGIVPVGLPGIPSRGPRNEALGRSEGGAVHGRLPINGWLDSSAGGATITVGAFRTDARRHRPREGKAPTGVPPWSEVQEAFEDALRALAESIEQAGSIMPSGRRRVVFGGGGRLVIPKWFIERMARAGVEVSVLDPESGELNTLEAD